MPAEDLRPLFTEQTASEVHRGLVMRPVAAQPRVALDRDTIALLRDGLGRFDMEIRWLVHLDESDTLRLWRSWTGHQIYQASLDVDSTGESARLSRLMVEQSPDRYTGSLSDEPALFERVLISTVDTLGRFRAGLTPYGPSSPAGLDPPPQPS